MTNNENNESISKVGEAVAVGVGATAGAAIGVSAVAAEVAAAVTAATLVGGTSAAAITTTDVYFDLFLLEQYVADNIADEGISLVMNDMERLVNPKNKTAKCWDYDISNNVEFGPIELDTPIGGKPVNIFLRNKYQLLWKNYGEFWFLEAEGKIPNAA